MNHKKSSTHELLCLLGDTKDMLNEIPKEAVIDRKTYESIIDGIEQELKDRGVQ